MRYSEFLDLVLKRREQRYSEEPYGESLMIVYRQVIEGWIPDPQDDKHIITESGLRLPLIDGLSKEDDSTTLWHDAVLNIQVKRERETKNVRTRPRQNKSASQW